jgi:hypothetical protein
MSLASAQKFVALMRADGEFRARVIGFAEHIKMSNYLGSRGFEFDMSELIRAMAACMAQLEQIEE